MFEIFDKELGNIKEGQKLPSKFPTKKLPSKEVFNRMQDLWILIRRCWEKNPRKRPNCFEVQERIKVLIENPLNIRDEDDDYITRFESNNDSCFDNQALPPTPEGSWVNTVVEDDMYLPSDSLQLANSTSWMLGDQESSDNGRPLMMESFDNLMPLMMKDLYRKLSSYAKRCDTRMLPPSGMNWSFNKQNRIRVDGFDVYNEHLLQPSFTAGSSTHYSQHLSPKDLPRLNFGPRNKSDTSVHKSHRNNGRGLMFLKSLGSVSSALSTSFSSQLEESDSSDRVEYCRPLAVSFKSNATNIADCKDRRFFQSRGKNLIAEEKPDTPEYLFTPDTPRSEAPDDNQRSYEIITDVGDNPRFSVVV